MAQTRANINSYNYGTAAPQPIPSYAPTIRITRSKQDKKYEALRKIYGVIIVLALAVFLASSVYMLKAKSEFTAVQNELEKKQTQLRKLKSDNDATEVYINSSFDIKEVYDIATTEFGMNYPTADQIIYYTRTDNGYVRQYEDIPHS